MPPISEDDQELARAALADKPGSVSRERALRRIHELLKDHVNCFKSYEPALAIQGDLEDHIQEFFARKVLPEARFRVLLAKVADGKCPLRIRLLSSFQNFLRSQLRRRSVPQSGLSVGAGEGEHDPQDKENNFEDTLVDRVGSQVAAIRQAFPGNEPGIPFGAVLLLSERLELAASIVASYSPEDGKTIGNQTACEMVEAVACWSQLDKAQLMKPRDVNLGQVWQEIREQTQERPQLLSGRRVASVLGITGDLWDQWLSRGRTRLAQRIGPEVARILFPRWPEGVFERAARIQSKGGPHE